ncbi:MAG: YeeE/YedE thiosulfate transporter family protein [candidate division KSB1 bacterium]|jgi:uncharacterized membrane protein YedE/YeeE|nr:YeeE/YedE thiosulfate transporter family protein [candidate division KSB1 bacterium]
MELERWSPYIVGIGIGILSWFTFLLSNQALACSTAFARSAGMIEKLFRGNKVSEKAYYQKFTPQIDWGWMLVVGVVIGAFISSYLSGSFQLKWVPTIWESAFGTNTLLRLAVAFVGGILMGLGSRWAGGCTSGHGISGTLQLTVSSWIAAISFFIGGIITAMFIFQIIA